MKHIINKKVFKICIVACLVSVLFLVVIINTGSGKDEKSYDETEVTAGQGNVNTGYDIARPSNCYPYMDIDALLGEANIIVYGETITEPKVGITESDDGKSYMSYTDCYIKTMKIFLGSDDSKIITVRQEGGDPPTGISQQASVSTEHAPLGTGVRYILFLKKSDKEDYYNNGEEQYKYIAGPQSIFVEKSKGIFVNNNGEVIDLENFGHLKI